MNQEILKNQVGIDLLETKKKKNEIALNINPK